MYKEQAIHPHYAGGISLPRRKKQKFGNNILNAPTRRRLQSPAPVGPDNQDWWCKTLRKVEEYAVEPTVICGWGVHGGFRDRDLEALHWLFGQQIKGPYCLGQTKAGFPKHPLYLPKTVAMERYRTTRSRKR